MPYWYVDPNPSCPGSLLNSTPYPPEHVWVPGGQEVTPEPKGSQNILKNNDLLVSLAQARLRT